MTLPGPNPEFWQQRFESGETAWDRGGPSPQLLAWLDSGNLTPCRIVVPGCGSGWEVVELARRGFEVTGIDYTAAAVTRARNAMTLQGLDPTKITQADVLQWQPDKPFDAIYEQTCLCALHPVFWLAYVAQLHRWLRPEGRLWALFMQARRPEAEAAGRVEGPPYHCDVTAMQALFPTPQWSWPNPPFPAVPHPNPNGWRELAVPLIRV